MTKVLVIAHLDDEVLWFNSGLDYDKIFITFLDNKESTKPLKEGRLKVLDKHPFKNKIEMIGLIESNYWKDKSKETEYKHGYDDLVRKLKTIVTADTEFWTHNSWGEYGHADHILVHNAVMEVAERFGLSVYCFNGIAKLDLPESQEIIIDLDMNIYNGLRQLYLREKVWTYDLKYKPKDKLRYYKIL